MVRALFRFSMMGWLSTTASMLMPKDVSRGVYLKRALVMMSGMVPFLRSMTTRMPLRSDSSRRSVTPSIFFSFTSAAMRSTMTDLFTP